jgi:hypothetical protein
VLPDPFSNRMALREALFRLKERGERDVLLADYVHCTQRTVIASPSRGRYGEQG